MSADPLTQHHDGPTDVMTTGRSYQCGCAGEGGEGTEYEWHSR